MLAYNRSPLNQLGTQKRSLGTIDTGTIDNDCHCSLGKLLYGGTFLRQYIRIPFKSEQVHMILYVWFVLGPPGKHLYKYN